MSTSTYCITHAIRIFFSVGIGKPVKVGSKNKKYTVYIYRPIIHKLYKKKIA